MSQLAPWSATAPLSYGTTLIEASAGTGKTYNITSLVVRLVAELAIPIERILVVTYTRAATAELKDRIRGRLVEAVDALTAEAAPKDPVLAHIWSNDVAIRSRRVRSLRDALESFDLALISTIHGFCQRMLQQNAFESGVAFDLELAPDTDALIDELVDDHLATVFYDADATRVAFLRGTCGFVRDTLRQLAVAALADPDTSVVPAADSADASGWATLIAELRDCWAALAESFVAYVDREVKAAKAGDPSVLKKGQRKHTGEAARVWADAVGEWLASHPPFGDLPPEPDRFSADKIKAQLVDPADPLAHDCLKRLEALCSFPNEVAGALRSAFVAKVRDGFEDRKQRRRVQTYQDLLRGLALRLDGSADPADRQALVTAIGESFDAALIDEFQDTDNHQWTIFHGVFGQGGHHLYLIGDPKQAIYGFRGANVHVYSEATGQAGERRYTMATNWRSDRRLLDGLNQLLAVPYAFGPSVSFGYVRVDAPEGRRDDGLRPPGDWAEAAPLEVRWFDGDLVGAEERDKPLTKGALDGVLEARVAEDVVALLQSGTEIRVGDGWRPVQAADIAMLVRKGKQALALQVALQAVGVPAVLTGAASVLASDEALEVQHWLQALADHAGGNGSRVAASTRIFGWTAEQLLAVEAEDPEAVGAWDAWLGRIAEWRELLQKRGFMQAFRRTLDDEGVIGRLLSLADGERRVTNLLHVAEIVHAAETRDRLQLGALLTWLTQRRSDEDLDSDEVELRLDRDAEAVRILTMHKAKGLEFPVCFVPYLWDGGMTVPKASGPLVVPDPELRTRRLLDVGIPTRPENRRLAEQEAKEEALRLAYVALTRGKHRCVVYAGLATDYEHSPLAAIFHGHGEDRLASGFARIDDGAAALRSDLERLAAASTLEGVPRMSTRCCEVPTGLVWTGGGRVDRDLAARQFLRAELDPGWRRHSYTSVTRAAGHPELVEDGREGFDPDATDEPVVIPGGGVAAEVPLAAFPAGPEAGTMLHEVFELADFAAASDPLRTVVQSSLRTHGFDVERYTELLTDGLGSVLRTPLGAALGDLRLCDLPKTERLDELRFDLPILGGTAFRGGSNPSGPARRLISALRSRVDGALPDSWLASLDRLERVRLAGFLTGSIDLVFRAPTPDGERRWFVADYKSNRLDPRRTGRCVPEAFGAAGMTHEMAQHDYFLQYHLYLVALHRFLRWRVADYDYDRHVGGVYYLFFRGMVGPDTARDGELVCGCWYDRPPREVVEALDRALEPELVGGAA